MRASSAGSRWSCWGPSRWVRSRSRPRWSGPGVRCGWPPPSCTTSSASGPSPRPGPGCSRAGRPERSGTCSRHVPAGRRRGARVPARLGRRIPRCRRVALGRGRGDGARAPPRSGCALPTWWRASPSPPAAAARVRRLGVRRQLGARPAGVGVPEHRAHPARPPPGRGRVAPAGRGDHPVDGLGRARHARGIFDGRGTGRREVQPGPAGAAPTASLRVLGWLSPESAAREGTPRARRPARAGSSRGRRRRRTSSPAAARPLSSRAAG